MIQGTSSDAAGDDFAYVACSGDREIWVLRIGSPDAAPQVVQKAEMPAPAGTDGGKGTPMAFSPDGLFAYLALRVPPFRVLTYRRDPASGELTYLDESRLPGTTPFLAVDQERRFLFSASSPGGIVAASVIEPNGCVRWPAVQIVHTGHKPHCIVVAADNRHVYATSTDDGMVHQWRLAPNDGSPLRPLEPAVERVQPFADLRHMTFSADGALLYLSTEDHGTAIVMVVDREKGTLAEVQRLPLFDPASGQQAHAADIQRTPDGRFLYISERSTNCVVSFGIEHDGRLRRLETFPTELRPRSFAINARGSLMLVAGQNSHAIRCHAIDAASGSLSHGFRMQVGKAPTWVALFAAASPAAS